MAANKFPDLNVFVKDKHHCQTYGWEVPPIMKDLYTERWETKDGPAFLDR